MEAAREEMAQGVAELNANIRHLTRPIPAAERFLATVPVEFKMEEDIETEVEQEVKQELRIDSKGRSVSELMSRQPDEQPQPNGQLQPDGHLQPDGQLQADGQLQPDGQL